MGRDNRDRWTFYQHPSKPVLDARDVRYWKTNLSKILKIGYEFEFNLPDKNGTCKGDNNACPCKHMATKDCWKECTRYEICKAERGEGFHCFGLFCSAFTTACISCNAFEVDCGSCKHRFDPEKNPDAVRERITRSLAPSNSYGKITKHGVHSVTTDGSLLGKKGAEVITTGRRVDYHVFYDMCKKIIDQAESNGAFINERCSIHAHILAAYYDKMKSDGVPPHISEMEKDMPEIILANFHQLCRRYQNAITWMTMGLDDPRHMTRWEKFRVSVLPISAVSKSMQAVREEVSSHAGGNKYGWVNYNNCAFCARGDVRRLHIEMRVMDALMAPSAVAAFGCLYYSLLIKAVEISRFGVMKVGEDGWLKRAESIKRVILNNTKNYSDGDRFGYTENLHHYYEDLIRDSNEMLAQVKPILMQTGPAYDVLEKLAERPCAVRRCDGETWQDIENDLKVQTSPEDEFVRRLREVIDMRYIDQCSSEVEWVADVAKFIKSEENEMSVEEIRTKIESFVEARKNEGEMLWLDRIGTMALI